ncbi:MAG: Stealth CR1 domain-containing protein [Pseudomonadota bacterium]
MKKRTLGNDAHDPTAHTDRNVDFVLTWVDGADPEHRERRLSHIHSARYLPMEKARHETRFHNNGEIYLAIASILKNAPFARHIWIVTDRQVPPLLSEFGKAGLLDGHKITIVDHQEILGDVPDALPTFNSITIESGLWRIEGLAEKYVYLNDDFVLLNALDESYFFDGDQPVIRGRVLVPEMNGFKSRRRRYLRRLTFRPPNGRPKYKLSQEIAARLTGRRKDFIHIEHWPHPVRRSTQEAFLRKNWKIFEKQVRYRFRDGAQYSAISLANHLEDPDTVLPPPRAAYLDPTQLERVTDELAAFTNGTCDVGCMQSLELFSKETQERLMTALVSRFRTHLPEKIQKHLLTEVA